MAVNKEMYREVVEQLGDKVRLVAVSKTKPVEDIFTLYELGQRDFGENYVQELVDKQAQLPADIRWHFIGHLQSNKVKSIASFIHLIHGVDSLKLLREIGKQAVKNDKLLPCLLQVHIAHEETKFGLDAGELAEVLQAGRGDDGAVHGGNGPDDLRNVRVVGLMGMASFTSDLAKVREEFRGLKDLFDKYFQPAGGQEETGKGRGILSMGMSSDYTIAIEEGSNMVRIGSLLFGERNYH